MLPSPFDPARASGAPRPGGARAGLRRSERGEITWVTLVLLAGVAAAGYWLWVWGPVYVVHYEVKQVVREYINQAVRNPNDRGARGEDGPQARDARRWWTGEGADGAAARVPAVTRRPGRRDLGPRRARTPPTLHVAFDYERSVTYPFLGRTGTKVFTVDIEGDLSRPDWGPGR